MTTAERYRERADEADRLAAIVSYGRDKERLRTQAAEWRRRAEDIEGSQATTLGEVRSVKLLDRLGSWIRFRQG